MNEYVKMKERHAKEIAEFPMFFAFNKSQFREGMESLGLKETDTKKIYAISGTGGFYRKSDAQKLHDMLDRQADEINKAIDEDKDGTKFIYDMFRHEMFNHEYALTLDLEDVLCAIGLNSADIEKNPALKKGLERAARDVLRDSNL